MDTQITITLTAEQAAILAWRAADQGTTLDALIADAAQGAVGGAAEAVRGAYDAARRESLLRAIEAAAPDATKAEILAAAEGQ